MWIPAGSMLPFGGIGRRRSVRGFSCVRLSCRPWSLRRSCRSSRSETPRLRFGSSRFAGRVQRWSGLSSCSGGKIRQGTGRVKLGDGSPIHGTEGFACLVAGLTRLAASPMISRSFRIAGTSIRSRSRSARTLPEANRAASVAASRTGPSVYSSFGPQSLQQFLVHRVETYQPQ